MRRIIKWLLRLGILAAVLIVILLLSLDFIIKSIVERRIRSQTGMDVKIGKMSVGLLSPVVTIENLKLYNTPEFGGLPFLEVKELHVEYDRDALARQKIRLKLVRLDIAELDVVKNEHGRTNIFGLAGSGDARLPEQTKRELEQFEFSGVDVLKVSVGRLRFIDLKNPKKNRDLEFNLKNQVFKNVRTEDDLKAVLILLWLRSGVGGGMLGVENAIGDDPPGGPGRSSARGDQFQSAHRSTDRKEGALPVRATTLPLSIPCLRLAFRQTRQAQQARCLFYDGFEFSPPTR